MRYTTLSLYVCLATSALSAPSEWTMQQARNAWKPMVRPVQHVGVPGYGFQTAVMWNGAVVCGPIAVRDLPVMIEELAPLGDNGLHLTVGYGDAMRVVDRQGTNHPDLARNLEAGRLPIPTVETRDGDLLWRETAFAHLLGRDMDQSLPPKSDDVLVTHVLFHVKNESKETRTAHLWLHFGNLDRVRFGYKCVQMPELAPSIDYQWRAPLGVMDEKVRFVLPPPKLGEWCFHEQVASPVGDATPAARVLEWQVELKPGAQAEARLILPYGLVSREVAQSILGLRTDALHRQVAAYWKRLEDGPGRITTPDPWLNDYLAAIPAQMAQQIAWRHHPGIWIYKTSPNNYENYWPCNAAKALPALDLRGLGDLNGHVLSGFMASQTDDVGGLNRSRMGHGETLAGEGFAKQPGFLGNFGGWTANPLLLSHGLGMWAMARHYRVTRDRAWLGDGPGSPLQVMLDGFDWIRVQRRRTMREEDGRKVAYWGLLPAASAHDWLAGSTIFNDVFCMYGMAEVVRVLRELGHPRAQELNRELEDYRACLHAAYAAATAKTRPIPMPDGSELPYVPRMVQELDWAKIDWTYTGYGPLRAGAWGAFAPDDRLVEDALAFLEAGMPKGQGPYFNLTPQSMQIADGNFADKNDRNAARHYLWRHYVEYETMWPIGNHLFLARDDLPRFFEWFFNNMAIVVHRDWRVGVESLDGAPSCAPGDGERWQAARSMFVNERAGVGAEPEALWLLQAIPRSWLQAGARMSVEDMGTVLGGKVDLSARVARDGNSLAVDVRLSGLAVKPTATMIRLRSGDGRPLASATVNGQKADVLPGDLVALPVETNGRWEIVGRF